MQYCTIQNYQCKTASCAAYCTIYNKCTSLKGNIMICCWHPEVIASYCKLHTSGQCLQCNCTSGWCHIATCISGQCCWSCILCTRWPNATLGPIQLGNSKLFLLNCPIVVAQFAYKWAPDNWDQDSLAQRPNSPFFKANN